MSLYEKFDKEMKDALRGKDAVRLSTLRMLKAAIKNAEIAKKVKQLEEGDIYQMIRKEIKQRKDSIEQFTEGARQDLVDKESKELAILEGYMPKEMGVDELARIVDEAIRESGAVMKKEAGKVMKIAMEKAKGMADGKVVSQLVMERLK